MIFQTLVSTWFALLHLTAMYGAGGVQTSSTNPAIRPTLEELWALDATYTDQQHGVTFQYPSVWKATTQFGYHPPALTESDVAKPIAGFGYQEGGFPRDHIVDPYVASNLEGFGIVYSAIPAASPGACEVTASSIAQTKALANRPVIFGGRSFSEFETGQAGMSQSNSGRLYAIYLRPTCYLFETDLALASGAFGSVQALSPEQLRFVENSLLKIMKSVRIAQRRRRGS